MQLMAEDTGEFTAAFTEEDIRSNLYEGGLKSWECSIDLVKELASSGTSISTVIEVRLVVTSRQSKRNSH